MRATLRNILVSATLTSALAGGASAQRNHMVPDQFSTIQAAVSASVSGDTVWVSPGVYNERVNFLGRDISVRSLGGAALTTIDAGGLGTAVSFISNEGPRAILSGFTVTGGQGTGGGPGAMLCINSTPTIRNCRFFRNAGHGGGAGAIDSLTMAAPTLFNCTFESNRGGDGYILQRDGGPGAIRCIDASVRVEDSTFIENIGGSADTAPDGVFGGAGAIQGRRLATRVTLRSCAFEGNVGGSSGASPRSFAGPGAIEMASSSQLIVEDCAFNSNRGGDGPAVGSDGGAGAIDTSSRASGSIDGSSFAGNRGGDGPTLVDGAGGPGAVRVSGGSGAGTGVLFGDCQFTGNDGGYGWSLPGGGAFTCVSRGAPRLEGCTLLGNTGGTTLRTNSTRGGAGAFHCPGGSVTATDCLIEDNQGGVSRDGGGPGVALSSGNASELTFDGCTLRNNRGSPGNVGGGYEAGHGVLHASAGGSARIEACLIEGNRGGNGAAADGGTGCLQVEGSASTTMVNSIVAGNIGGDSNGRAGDGALDLNGSGTTIIANCTVTLNQGGVSSSGNHGIGGIRLDSGEVVNSIVWGNSGSAPSTDLRLAPGTASVMHSCVGQGVGGQGNFSSDPRLVDAAGGNFGIDCASPCRDAGTLSSPELPDLDFEGDFRVFGASVDVGADESIFGPIGQTGCVPTINSSGLAAGISADGTASLAGNCFSLLADGVTGAGAFFYSKTLSQVPFGDGFRCVTGQVYRLRPIAPNNSTLFMGIAPMELTGTLTPGATWHFQAWYRDASSSGAGFNTSESISITFTP